MSVKQYQIPPCLKPGDTVGIAATARKINKEELQPALNWLESAGLKYRLSVTLFETEYQLAGSPEKRAQGLQQLLDDKQTRAIWIVRGGYGTVQLIDLLDFSQFIQNPKWIIGYSDITVLHSHIHQLGFAGIHADMPVNFLKENKLKAEAKNSLKAALFQQADSVPIQNHVLSRNGIAEGVLTGGNLSVLYSLLQSRSFPDTTGKILFIEDLDEYLYHIDRMMYALKRGGVLDNLAGLVVGGMTGMNDNAIPFGRTAIEIISNITREYNYPVIFGLQAGHLHNNRALVFGQAYRLTPAELMPIVK